MPDWCLAYQRRGGLQTIPIFWHCRRPYDLLRSKLAKRRTKERNHEFWKKLWFSDGWQTTTFFCWLWQDDAGRSRKSTRMCFATLRKRRYMRLRPKRPRWHVLQHGWRHSSTVQNNERAHFGIKMGSCSCSCIRFYVVQTGWKERSEEH